MTRDLLIWAAVLASLPTQTTEEITKLCSISYQSIKICADKLRELYKRGGFNKLSLEQKVYKAFKNFMYFYKNTK